MEQAISETTGNITADLIPWEARDGVWGVTIDLANGRSADYEVGPRAAAELERNRVAAGEPPTLGPWAGLILLT